MDELMAVAAWVVRTFAPKPYHEGGYLNYFSCQVCHKRVKAGDLGPEYMKRWLPNVPEEHAPDCYYKKALDIVNKAKES